MVERVERRVNRAGMMSEESYWWEKREGLDSENLHGLSVEVLRGANGAPLRMTTFHFVAYEKYF
jgi:hypothetical protein